MSQEPLQAPEAALRAVLEFASLWREGRSAITTTDQVHDLMQPAADALGSSVPFLRLPADEEPIGFRNDQAALRKWLATLLRWRRTSAKDRERTLVEVAQWASLASVGVQTVVEDGDIRRKLVVHANGVQSVIGETLARLLADDARRAAAIGQCPVCATYFLKSRKDAKTCSTRCRVALHRKES